MFIPQRILFEKDSLNYEVGKRIYNYFSQKNEIELIELRGNKIKENIPGDNLYDFYRAGKKTLVVGIKKSMKFQSCKPSAHYQLPLISGCIGQCQYCYLNTNLSDKPYIRINVNTDDILAQADSYLQQRFPDTTIFEGSATSDPIPVEPYSHSLEQAVEFFAASEMGRFRFVTKYVDVDNLLPLKHNNHTEIRFTLNTDSVIQDYERGTPSLAKRIDACRKISQAGYPMGFIIAPVFLYDDWRTDYHNLLINLKKQLPAHSIHPITFEIISHRYTTRAKNVIMEVFPDNNLPMTDEERTYKYGQFGYGKYVYPKNYLVELSEFFQQEIPSIFDHHKILYII